MNGKCRTFVSQPDSVDRKRLTLDPPSPLKSDGIVQFCILWMPQLKKCGALLPIYAGGLVSS
jgi:hypothetical protein